MLLDRIVAGGGSSADSMTTSMHECCACVAETFQANFAASGNFGFTTGMVVQGWLGSRRCHPVLVSSAPHELEPAGKVVVQKLFGSGGTATVASAYIAMTRTLLAGCSPAFATEAPMPVSETTSRTTVIAEPPLSAGLMSLAFASHSHSNRISIRPGNRESKVPLRIWDTDLYSGFADQRILARLGARKPVENFSATGRG